MQSIFDKYDSRFLRISSFDSTQLAAKLYEPKARSFPGPRPTLILANSWTLNETEYEAQARIFANKGYIVLSYASRGFGTSGGFVNVGSEEDMKDVSSIIDWLQDNTNVDGNKIAMGGVSYGGGLALLATAKEPRIKVALSMSAWGNLEQSLYGQDTIRQVWISALLGTGLLFGRLSPEVMVNIDRLKKNKDIELARKWAVDRSPESVVDLINARQVPIFLANSYQDNLFPPNQMRPFYQKLTGPKMFYLDRGIHASSALPGLFGLPSQIWAEAHRWLDHHLCGVDTGIENQAPVSFQAKNGREYFPSFPSLQAKNSDLSLTPLNSIADQENLSAMAEGEDAGAADADGESDSDSEKPSIIEAIKSAIIKVGGGEDSGATSGLPLISESADAMFDRPVQKFISRIDKRYAAVYISRPLAKLGRLRGAPRVSLFLEKHDTPLQLVAYLYSVDGAGLGTLVTHGVFSRRQGHTDESQVELQLGTIAYDIPAGNRLVVALDTRDPLYENPSTDAYSLAFKHADPEATILDLPLLP